MFGIFLAFCSSLVKVESTGAVESPLNMYLSIINNNRVFLWLKEIINYWLCNHRYGEAIQQNS